MSASKRYIIDTNVLIDNPSAIENLLDSNKNTVTIPVNVLKELDNLKTDNKIGHLVRTAIKNIIHHYEQNEIKFLNLDGSYDSPDGRILQEILSSDLNDSIFLSNDKVFSLFSKLAFEQNSKTIQVEEYKNTQEYISDPKLFTGVLNSDSSSDNQVKASNFFTWDKSKGTLNFHSIDGVRDTNFNSNPHTPWKLKPRHWTQHMALDLLLNDNIDLVSIQGSAGYGKTMCALAAGLYLTLEKKKYDRILFIKSNVQIGIELGFLPGNLDEKLEPYNEYIKELLFKLHNMRNAKKIFDGDPMNKKLDEKVFKIIPLNFIRGMNIDKSYVIIDECQNLSKSEMKTILTRMGENVKCVLLGDTSQIDAPKLNEYNNGLSILVRNLISNPNYAHMVLKGKHSRGPITDMILNSEI